MQSNGKGIIYGAVFVGGLGMLYLVFSLQAREEVKLEQRIRHIEKRIDSKKFDAEFDSKWNEGKVIPRSESTSADEKELASLKVDQKRQDADHSETQQEFADALSQASQSTGHGLKKDLEKALAKGGKP